MYTPLSATAKSNARNANRRKALDSDTKYIHPYPQCMLEEPWKYDLNPITGHYEDNRYQYRKSLGGIKRLNASILIKLEFRGK